MLGQRCHRPGRSRRFSEPIKYIYIKRDYLAGKVMRGRRCEGKQGEQGTKERWYSGAKGGQF